MENTINKLSPADHNGCGRMSLDLQIHKGNTEVGRQENLLSSEDGFSSVFHPLTKAMYSARFELEAA